MGSLLLYCHLFFLLTFGILNGASFGFSAMLPSILYLHSTLPSDPIYLSMAFYQKMMQKHVFATLSFLLSFSFFCFRLIGINCWRLNRHTKFIMSKTEFLIFPSKQHLCSLHHLGKNLPKLPH